MTINTLTSNDQKMEMRFFRQACFFSVVASMAFWMIVVVMNLPAPLWLCTLGSAIFSGLLLYLTKSKISLPILSRLFLLSHCTALSVGFFYNGGVQATVLFVYFLLAAIYLYIFPRHGSWFIGFLILNGALLIGGDYLGLAGEPPHKSKMLRYIDIWLAWSVCMIVMGWVSRFAKKAYEVEKAKALSSLEAKSRFLATMSHEIRTPLNGIIGINSMALEKTAQDSEIRSHLELVAESSEHLLAVVNDILDYSKMEAGQMILDKHPFGLVQLLDRLVESFIIQANSKGLNLRLEMDKELEGMWLGDAQRLRQILYNLLSNALKFTERGEILIRVSLVAKKETEWCSFEVIDTGIGIAENDLLALFQEFVQAGQSTSRIYGGTGLGLSICKNLVELMQGKIKVKSEKGRGSNFSFEIPLERDLRPHVESNVVSEDFAQGRKGRILLVEDNLMNQKVAASVLKKIGLDFVIANNGREAIDLLDQESFHLVLMDLEMPVLDGLSAVKEIRKSEAAYREIPVIAITAHALSTVKEKCLEAGMNSYITKPLRLQELKDVIHEHLES